MFELRLYQQKRLKNAVFHLPAEIAEAVPLFQVNSRLLPMVLVAKPLKIQHIKCEKIILRASKLGYLN